MTVKSRRLPSPSDRLAVDKGFVVEIRENMVGDLGRKDGDGILQVAPGG